MNTPVIWEGVCDQNESYKTKVSLESGKVWLRQESTSVSYDNDIVIMETNEAVDIAFSILKELTPTLYEALIKLNVDTPEKV